MNMENRNGSEALIESCSSLCLFPNIPVHFEANIESKVSSLPLLGCMLIQAHHEKRDLQTADEKPDIPCICMASTNSYHTGNTGCGVIILCCRRALVT